MQEYELTIKLATLQGAIQMVLAARSSDFDDIQQTDKILEPTAAAREEFVVHVN